MCKLSIADKYHEYQCPFNLHDNELISVNILKNAYPNKPLKTIKDKGQGKSSVYGFGNIYSAMWRLTV